MSSFVRTGVSGLDELLNAKGFRKGHVVLVLGVPGSGKTTLGIQFLLEGAKSKEKVVYVTLDESPSLLKENAEAMGLNCSEYEEKGFLTFIDASPIRYVPGEVKLAGLQIGKRDFALASFIASLTERVKEIGPGRLVLDPISTLMVQYTSPAEVRTAFLDLLQAVTELNCTSLFISELSASSLRRTHSFEEYLAHGVIVMTRLLVQGGFIKVFFVEKMRGIPHDDQPHPYRIGSGGVEIYYSESAL